jgi:myo-inositol-1(or 4)-monophosphatase
LKDLEGLARQAGDILRAGYGRRPQIHYKGVIDLVTDVDHESEDYLLGEIRRCFPDHAIQTEESGSIPGGSVGGQDCCVWYIDPMDGTVNFAHGLPFFAVSIGYAEGGAMRLGAVYDPLRDEMYLAQRGRGAWLNGRPIHVSAVDNLDQSLLVTGFPYDIRTHPVNNLVHFNHFMLLSQGVRRLGSAALDLCYVAAGRLDGFWEVRLKPWDVAAGGLIVEEAGGAVTDIQGDPDYLGPPSSILACAPGIQARMLAVLNDNFPSPNQAR